MSTDHEDTELAVFDPGMLVKIVGNNPPLHHRLLGKFLLNAQERRQSLQEAFDRQDVEAIIAVSHSLKSAARSIGAMQLGGLCEQLEFAGKANDFDKALQLSSSFEESYLATNKTIKTVISEK